MFRGFRGSRILFDTGSGGSGGGNGGGGNSAGDLAVQELRELRRKYDELVNQHNDVVKNFNKLEAEHGKLQTKFETVSAENGTYRAGEARKAALDKALESAEVKGKLNVDRDKAMKYLSRGAYDEARLADEVKEAIEMFGEAVEAKGTSLGSRGTGDESVKRDVSQKTSDPIGAAAAGL